MWPPSWSSTACPPGERVIGFAFDGTGYGEDGTIWGGEVLVAGYDAFVRAAHLRQVPLPGGDAAIRKPYRAALAHLWAAGIGWDEDLPPVGAAPEPSAACCGVSSSGASAACRPRAWGGSSTPSAPSSGSATSPPTRPRPPWSSSGAPRHTSVTHAATASSARTAEFDPGPLLADIVDDLRSGQPIGAIAAGFHVAVAELITEVAERLRHDTRIDRVALTGGVFQNVLLLEPGPPRPRCAAASRS